MSERASPSRFWRLKGQYLRLEGSIDTRTGELHFPPRPISFIQNEPIELTQNNDSETVQPEEIEVISSETS